MTTIRVFRPEFDKHGRPVHSDIEDDYLGDISGVVIGAATAGPVRPGLVSTEGLIGIPHGSTVVVQQHDRVEIRGLLHKVIGPSQWGYSHSSSDTTTSWRYWVEVRSLNG